MARRLLDSAAPLVGALDVETAALIHAADGETTDLVPGVPDKQIPTVKRLRALARHVKTRVLPAVEACVPAGEPLRVLVENQMSYGVQNRAIMCALVALFAEHDVVIVGPTLKNKVATCEEGRYCHFAAKYAAAYGANKAHALFNFLRLEALFGTAIPATRPASLRGHIADGLMQILGHLLYGTENAVDHF